jgi:DNA replication and repair protein RecF
VRLIWIEIRDFRNYRELSLQVPAGLTAVVGPNGQGKTNLLEALHYLCALESPRVSSDLPLVRSPGHEPSSIATPSPAPRSAFLRGEAESDGSRLLIEVEVRAGGQNRVQANRSAVRRKRDVRRQIRAVFSGPDDLRIVQGDPEDRRRFMDEVVRALWPAKDNLAGAYERALRQRNRLLKDWAGSGQPPELEAWDGELIGHGVSLTLARHGAVEAIRSVAAEEFQALTARGAETLVVEYRPSVEESGTPPGKAPASLTEVFRERLAARREDELLRRTTLVGPHRDELGLTIRGLTARGFASHGETWAAALCLRLAEARAVADEVGEAPILLLDDPFSALDPVRRRRLAGALGARGQVLIAIPDEAQLPRDASVWGVEGGRVAPRPAA